MSVSYNDLIDMIKRQEIRKNACLSQPTLPNEEVSGSVAYLQLRCN